MQQIFLRLLLLPLALIHTGIWVETLEDRFQRLKAPRANSDELNHTLSLIQLTVFAIIRRAGLKISGNAKK